MRAVFLVLILLFNQYCLAQSGLDSVLLTIRQNNYELRALKKQEEWKRAEYNVNRFLPDPVVEYDYLFGVPKTAGSQVDFTVSQPFDFPSVYSSKKELARQQERQLKIEYQLSVQERLLQVKHLLLEKIYLNKRQAILNHRTRQAAALLYQYGKKLSHGEATILERNKAQVFLFQVRKDSAINETSVKSAVIRLEEMNGGRELQFMDTVYPVPPLLPPFPVLDSMIEAEDIEPQLYQNELSILAQQVRVQKALNLPRFELGYHSQTILNQGYKGVHFSITVPINENRNKLQAVRANLQYEQFKHDQHRIEHRLRNMALYNELVVQRKNMEDYASLINDLHTEKLLQKALELGELAVSEYIKEKDAFFVIQDDYLKAELAYYQALASLFRFKIEW